MQGMLFVEVIEGRIAGQGVVQDCIGPGFYKLTWQGSTPLSRVVSVERMQSMFLFNTMDEVQAWFEEVSQNTPPAESPAEDIIHRTQPNPKPLSKRRPKKATPPKSVE